MASVRRSIDVPGPRAEVAAAWADFIEGVLVGRRRLACDELACVDPVDAELVGFEALDERTTRVSVTIPVGAGSGEVDLLGRKAAQDLVVFQDYVASGEHRREHAPDETVDAGLREDVRRGRLTPRRAQADAEPLSIRRSGRS